VLCATTKLLITKLQPVGVGLDLSYVCRISLCRGLFLCFDIQMSAVLGEEEPLVSHTVESDIKVLKKDSLIMSKVSSLNTHHV